jgi:parallel beta-helix repeat protein
MMHKVLTSILFALVLMTVVPGALASADVILNPGDDVQAAVNANPNGTRFVLNPGVFRFDRNGQRVYPKPGNTFKGSGRGVTVLNGSRVLTGWTQSGNYWYVNGQTQQGYVSSIGCSATNPACYCYADHPRCVYPEELFVDGARKILIGVHDSVYNDPLSLIGPGKWYFDYTTGTIYVGDDPTGHTVETSVASFAFVGATTTDNVTIRDMSILQFATFSQFGAIHAASDYTQALTNGWVVDNVEVAFNHGDGIRTGHSTQVLNSFIHNNGILGIGGGGATYNLIKGNKIAYNNQDWMSVANEAGGLKYATQASNNTIRNNAIHDNIGPGFWCDYCGGGQLIEGNTVINNLHSGIYEEVSAGAIIRHNIVRFNGYVGTGWLFDAQIQMSTSWNHEVYGNTVEIAATYGNGITITDQVRAGASPVTDNYVHDNLVIYNGVRSGSVDLDLTGAATDYVGSPVFTDNNRFVRNTYCVPDTSGAFWTWGSSDVNWSQWQANGQDTTGVLYLTDLCAR